MKNSIHGDHTMAQLNSPGVSVTVIDESFYTPAAPGTVPLIIVASAEGKANASNTGTAPGTLKVNSGQVYLLTSQKDLVDTFGTPIFYTDSNNNPIHAGEMNEYGLQAAYSFLGVSNRAYVVRADLDLGQLSAASQPPAGPPEDGAFWFDTTDTKFGIFEWNSASSILGGQLFKNKAPTVITDPTEVDQGTGGPLPSIGSIGSYAIVASNTTVISTWYKKANTGSVAYPAGTWVRVGSPEWIASRPAAQGLKADGLVLDTADKLIFTVEGQTAEVTNVQNLSALVTQINNYNNSGNPLVPGISAAIINNYLEIYTTGVNFTLSGTSFAKVMGFKAADGTELTTASFMAPALEISPHYTIPTYKRVDNPNFYNGRPTGSVWIKTTTPNLGANWIINRYNATTNLWENKSASLYATNVAALNALDPTGGGFNLPIGTVYVKYNEAEETPARANFKIYARRGTGATVVKSAIIDNTTFANGTQYSFKVSETRKGQAGFYPVNAQGVVTPVTVTFTGTGSAGIIDTVITAMTSELVDSSIVVEKAPNSNQIIISHKEGGDIKFEDVSNNPAYKLFFGSVNFYNDPAYGTGQSSHYVASLWTSSVNNAAFVTASPDPLVSEPVDGALWYNSNIEDVDIMIHNGTDWVGYKNVQHNEGTGGPVTEPTGPFVMASQPTAADRTDGETELGHGDLWIDTSDLENYPKIHKYDYTIKKWILLDNSDQTTENGVLFDDARWGVNGGTTDTAPDSSIIELLTSDYLDADAPNPALYPRGMLLWNLRRSGYNVKKFVRNFVDTLARNPRHQVQVGESDVMEDELMTNYYPHRWVSWAPNQADGAGSFGRKAQRGVVIQALQALVNSNQAIRDEESRIFNLIACPGYSELISEMISLNTDRGLTSFVVGDSPARLAPDATSLSNWGNNLAGALQDDDKGLISYDEYMAVYYPWGYSSDNFGNNVAVPPSHMMLRTIALSDNVSYPWFAPAGTRRGGITNASAVGYITSEGEFQSISLNTGQRDTLASIKVNPITYINGAGIICYGQRTRARNASALDRINVARLVVYLRRQFTQLAKPYIFEPNDKITRDEIKGAAESLLLELVGQRALYDYIVVCDTSNNTPARIDRNELYLDVAIEPVKAVEFIYIPLRLKNTGTINNIASQ